MKLKTIRELESISKHTPTFVASTVLLTLASEMMMPSPIMTAVKTFVFSFGGVALILYSVVRFFSDNPFLLDDQSGE